MSPIKEPNFFVYDAAADMNRHDMFPIRSFADYQALFSGVTNQRAVGEPSATYHHRSAAAGRIKESLPEVRLTRDAPRRGSLADGT